MAQNVEVIFDNETGMLHFIVDPTLCVGETKNGKSLYVAQSDIRQAVPGAKGFYFSLSVWVNKGEPQGVQKAEPAKLPSEFAKVWTKRGDAKATATPKSGIAPGQTVAINRVRG